MSRVRFERRSVSVRPGWGPRRITGGSEVTFSATGTTFGAGWPAGGETVTAGGVGGVGAAGVAGGAAAPLPPPVPPPPLPALGGGMGAAGVAGGAAAPLPPPSAAAAATGARRRRGDGVGGG